MAKRFLSKGMHHIVAPRSPHLKDMLPGAVDCGHKASLN